MDFLIANAYAQAAPAAAASSGSDAIGIVFLVGMVLVFYLMVWRPQSKRAKEMKALHEGLQKGDEVLTSGGIVGRTVKLSDDYVVVEVADNVELKFQKSSILAVLPKGTIKEIMKAN